MTSLEDIRAGIVANLAPLRSTIKVEQILPYTHSNPTPPTVMVDLRGPISYDKTMGRGHDEWTFVVVALVGTVSEKGAQIRLDEMLDSGSPSSVKELIESDKTLGGTVEETNVVSCTGPRQYVRDVSTGTQKPPYLGAEWTVEVWAS